jgi:hypothetical protein
MAAAGETIRTAGAATLFVADTGLDTIAAGATAAAGAGELCGVTFWAGLADGGGDAVRDVVGGARERGIR